MAKKAKTLTKAGRSRTGSRPGSGKRVKGAAKKGPALVLAKRAVTRAGRGPALPLRDLLRDGMPRSPKAHRTYGMAEPSGRVKRHTRSAYGLKHGSTLVQNPPGPREWQGVMKPGIPKR